MGVFFSFFYLSVDDGREAEIVEDLCAVPPHGDGAELAEALVVKAVDLRDLARLVVAPDECDAVWISHLERQQKQEGLDAVESPVDKVAHEEVVRVGHVAAHFEQLFEVVELSVNVSAYLGQWGEICNVKGASCSMYVTVIRPRTEKRNFILSLP